MDKPLLDLPETQRKLLRDADSRIEGYRRNSTYRIESALRSADAALRALLRVWLWQQGGDQRDANADVLRQRCVELADNGEVIEAADTTLSGCAALRAEPPRHPNNPATEGDKEALHRQIERESVPSQGLENLRRAVEAALAPRVHVKAGDWLRHPHRGLLFVTEVAGLTIAVEEATGGWLKSLEDEPLRLPLLYDSLERADATAEAATAAGEDAETFVLETSENENHGPASHWQPFMDSETMLDKLPTWVNEAQLLPGYGDISGPSRPSIIPWRDAFLLASPKGVRDMAMVLTPAGGRNQLLAWWPRYEHGAQERVTLKRVYVFPDRQQAQLEIEWDEASLCFFDESFVPNRPLYIANHKYEFLLNGIAYSCAPAPDYTFEMSENVRKKLLEEGLADDDGDPDQFRIHTQGMAMLIPADLGDRDDYKFRGNVQKLEPVKILDVPGWLLTVTVLREVLGDSDAELNLPIVVTERVWQASRKPEIGMDVHGFLWLQGRLWYVP